MILNIALPPQEVAMSAAEAEKRLVQQVRELKLAEKALIKDIEAGNSG